MSNFISKSFIKLYIFKLYEQVIHLTFLFFGSYQAIHITFMHNILPQLICHNFYNIKFFRAELINTSFYLNFY